MDSISINLWSFFEWLLKTTIQGSILICLILLVKTILRDKLPIRWHYYLWLLLLVRILLPWAPQSRLSIFNLIPPIIQAETIISSVKRAAFFGFASFLPYVWLIGALILGSFILLRSFGLWRVVKLERPITDEKILDLLEDCKVQMHIQTVLGVVVSDRVKSPALFGYIRPRLLLPQGMIETHELKELRYIFIHELAHLKQRDIHLSWLMSLLQVVYWFNPLMWFALRRVRLEREFACDGLALSTLSTDEPPRYGHTIVNLLERFSNVNYVPSIAGIIEDTSQIERRIKTIAGFKATSRAGSAIAVLVFALLAAVTLTDASPAEPLFKFGIPRENLQIPKEMRACAKNLDKIYAAIKAYEKNKAELPNWLSDLVPDYLSEQDLLCGSDTTGGQGSTLDPEMPCSYSYQFSLLKASPPALDPTGRMTYQEWKQHQVNLFGDVVPMVRCKHHGSEVVLNLSRGGQIYVTSDLWERMFISDYTRGMELPKVPIFQKD